MDTTNTNHDTPRGTQTQTHDDTVSPEEHVDASTPASASAPASASTPADREATTPPSRDAQDPPPAATEPESATPASSPSKPRQWDTLLNTPAAGWVATAIATLIAAVIRLTGLDNVRTLIFDETYYVKDAWSLLTLGYEGTWPQNYDPTFAAGDTSKLSATASYAVHPPTGKWIIALGMKLFDRPTPSAGASLPRSAASSPCYSCAASRTTSSATLRSRSSRGSSWPPTARPSS